MYARITQYKMKPGSREATLPIMESLKDQIMQLPGMVQFINVMDDNGAGYVVSLSELAETPPEAAEKIKSIWGAFADFVEDVQEAATFEVAANWRL